MTAYEKLQKKYELEASLMELEARQEELQSRLPELKFQKREAEEASLAAQSGLKHFWGRLLGKEEEVDSCAQKAQAAASALAGVQRDLEIVERKLSAVRKENADLGEKTALMAELNPEGRMHFRYLEASLCAEGALHFLRKTRKELSAAQELARNPMMAIGDGQRENIHQANAAHLADQCREKLERIVECGIDFQIHAYLKNPMGYLATAARYADLDRYNSAQQGIRETEAAIKELLLQLSDV